MLNLPEWDLVPEDAMQFDSLPNLPTSGGYQTAMRAIDVFSRYQFAYPLIEATVANVAKVLFWYHDKKFIPANNSHHGQIVCPYLRQQL